MVCGVPASIYVGNQHLVFNHCGQFVSYFNYFFIADGTVNQVEKGADGADGADGMFVSQNSTTEILKCIWSVAGHLWESCMLYIKALNE